jgi:hypothetical protein
MSSFVSRIDRSSYERGPLKKKDQSLERSSRGGQLVKTENQRLRVMLDLSLRNHSCLEIKYRTSPSSIPGGGVSYLLEKVSTCFSPQPAITA